MAGILLIEVDIELNKLMKNVLEQSGFEVNSALNGIEGLKLFKMNPAKLLLLIFLCRKKKELN
jgi:DNA-binding response OmpR family regulator